MIISLLLVCETILKYNSFALLFPFCLDIDLSLFLDAATLREVEYDSSLESGKIRSSTGLAVNWFTVLGPLSFSYAIPITDASSDKTESFRFQIGTSF